MRNDIIIKYFEDFYFNIYIKTREKFTTTSWFYVMEKLKVELEELSKIIFISIQDQQNG